MNRQDRAKQFMPFAALKGYEEALKEREKRTEPRIVLGEDGAEELDRKLRSLSIGNSVRIRHYRRRCYAVTEGTVEDIMYDKRQLKVGKEEIKYEDIADIDLL